ncbi:YnbE family lipoprotein [Pseudoalteromonas sp. MMG010]|uniref:YnbE family lipoprotein n=1 Tax=Pseudoalteromonas sp. MMG010 TaxID=2822685 RepID=UPI001B3A7AC2|nr:YnbE family lipoprotein [Pseudoalteromonas sp. MMG010]MBQ4832186.1 YnbE family lipoprotein [Pseudoalteromonas sp. MMG010]
MNKSQLIKALLILMGLSSISACTHRVEVATKEPITINLNVKVDHEIRVKVDKELDDLFGDDSELF